MLQVGGAQPRSLQCQPKASISLPQQVALLVLLLRHSNKPLRFLKTFIVMVKVGISQLWACGKSVPVESPRTHCGTRWLDLPQCDACLSVVVTHYVAALQWSRRDSIRDR
jgi:hypothetical protein